MGLYGPIPITSDASKWRADLEEGIRFFGLLVELVGQGGEPLSLRRSSLEQRAGLQNTLRGSAHELRIPGHSPPNRGLDVSQAGKCLSLRCAREYRKPLTEWRGRAIRIVLNDTRLRAIQCCRSNVETWAGAHGENGMAECDERHLLRNRLENQGVSLRPSIQSSREVGIAARASCPGSRLRMILIAYCDRGATLPTWRIALPGFSLSPRRSP